MSTLKERLAALREAIPKRAPKEPDPPGVTVTAAMVRGANLASLGAYFALMYFLWFKVLSVSQAQYATMEVSHFLPWSNLTLQLHFPLLIAYLFVVATVPYVAKQIIPLMVSIRFKENPWAKSLAIGITLLVSFVLVAGTATVGGKAVIESEREHAVAVERVGQERAALQARLEAVEKDIQDLTGAAAGNRLTAQAARVGEAQWKVAIAEAERSNAPLMPQRRAALASAIRGDELRKRREDLIAQIASTTAVASVSSEVTTAKTGALSGVMTFLDTFWVLLLALVMDIVCLLMPFLSHVISRTRERQLAEARGEVFVDKGGEVRTPWADESQMISDMTEQPNAQREADQRAARAAALAVFSEGGSAEEAAAAAQDAVEVGPQRQARDEKGEGLYWRAGTWVRKPTRPKKVPDDKPVLGAHDDRVARVEQTGVEVGDEAEAAFDDLVPAGDDDNAAVNGADDVQSAVDHVGGDDGGSADGAAISSPDAAAALYAFLADPNPGPDPKGVTVYDAPAGPQQPTRLGQEGKDGVMIAAE